MLFKLIIIIARLLNLTSWNSPIQKVLILYLLCRDIYVLEMIKNIVDTIGNSKSSDDTLFLFC